MKLLEADGNARSINAEFAGRDVSSGDTTLTVILRARTSSKKDDRKSVRLEWFEDVGKAHVSGANTPRVVAMRTSMSCA